jgi:hypothetical protein
MRHGDMNRDGWILWADSLLFGFLMFVYYEDDDLLFE